MRDPTNDEPAHALVFGKKTRNVQRKLAKGAHWIISPPSEQTQAQNSQKICSLAENPSHSGYCPVPNGSQELNRSL
jgi:hypothetical protein